VHSLEERVAYLEAKLQRPDCGNMLSPPIPEQSTREVDRHGSSSTNISPSNNDMSTLHRENTQDGVANFSDVQPLRSGTDDSFVRHLSHSLPYPQRDTGAHVSQPHGEPGTLPGEVSSVIFTVPQNIDPLLALLPRISVAEQLTEVYFELANFSAPLLHEPTFRQKLHFVYALQESGDTDTTEGTRHDSGTAHFFVYMVLGIALLTLQKHDATGVSTSLCERYRDAAIRCLGTGGELSSLEGVQSLLLLSQYSYLHPYNFEPWAAIGTALRLAIELGLHRDPPSGTVDPLTLDTRRRVFWVAYSMDRTLATVLNRPVCLSDGVIDVQVSSYTLDVR
jgi:hypothetical protein